MAQPNQIFTVADLRGGINNSDSAVLLPDNQVVDARNVDFRSGVLGAKRRGTQGIDITGSLFDSPIVAIFKHSPTNSINQEELWAIDEDGNLDRRVGGSWQGGVPVVNDFIIVNATNYSANAVSLHGNLFIAARGQEDRLLVWDGTVLRWAGFWQTPIPTVADTGSGTYATTRYFRIRYTEQDSLGNTLRRSEPSTAVSLTPSGSGSGSLITKPSGTEATTSLYCEGQTHWEVEASLDNILFYRIATVEIATTTYTDTTSASTGYAANTLSEAIGEYVPPGSAKYVAIDEDRVVMAGSNFEDELGSTVWWTPVGSADGVGNDERIPTGNSQYIAFDTLDGGAVTALVAGVAGSVYVFKRTRIYKMVRTGILEAAYSPIADSYTRGCDSLGAIGGTDTAGLPCVYFVDPSVGLCVIGRDGVADLARSIRSTWFGHNPSPAIPSRILFYPALAQVWYTLPISSGSTIQTADGSDIETDDLSTIVTSQSVPDLMAMYDATTGGIIFYDGIPSKALAFALSYRSTGYAPVIGTELKDIGSGNTSYLHDADIGVTDSDGDYRAYMLTKPYLLGDFWTKFGMMAAVIMARASSGATLFLNMVRNLGVEEVPVYVSLSPYSTEEHVIKPVDDASMSDLNTIQLEFGDEDVSDQEWDMDRIAFKVRQEEGTAG